MISFDFCDISIAVQDQRGFGASDTQRQKI